MNSGEKQTARQTSIDVYHQIRANGMLAGMRWKVYDVLYQQGPVTRGELQQVTGIDYVYNRLSELRRMGVVQIVGTRACRVTGNVCQLWDVTSALPVRIRRNPRPSVAALCAAVVEIRKLQNAGHTASPELDEVADWLEGL